MVKFGLTASVCCPICDTSKTTVDLFYSPWSCPSPDRLARYFRVAPPVIVH